METTHRLTITERGTVTHISHGDLATILDEAEALDAPYRRSEIEADLEQDGYMEFQFSGMIWVLEAI